MSLSRLHLRTRLDIFNVFFTISSIHSNPSPSPLLLSRLRFVFVSISSMSSLQYRRYTLIRLSSSPPLLPLHFRRQFQLFISSPSSMHPRTPLPSTFNTSRFPLGAPSVSIRLSQCRLLCPYVSYTDACVTVVDDSFVSPFSPFRPFFSLQLFNTYVESVLSMQFFYSVPSQARSRRVCSRLHLHLSSSTFSPTSRRPPDVHLSLTSGCVH